MSSGASAATTGARSGPHACARETDGGGADRLLLMEVLGRALACADQILPQPQVELAT